MEFLAGEYFLALGTICISILGLTILPFGHFLTPTRRAALALIPTSAALFFGISPLAACAYPVCAQHLHASPVDATEVVVGSLNTPGHLPTHLPALPGWTPGTVVAQPNSSLTRGLSTPHCWNPDSIFDVVVSIPTEGTDRWISGGISNRDTAALNVGGVIALPEGFKAAGTAGSALTIAFNSPNANDIVFGPQPVQLCGLVVYSCQAERKDLPFSKYPLLTGDGQSRGQIYPDGELSNIGGFRSQSTSVTVRQHFARGGSGTNIALAGSTGEINIQHLPASSSLPAGPALTTGLAPSEITLDAPLTYNPNVGGYRQSESSIVVQSPARICVFSCARSFDLGTSVIGFGS